MRAPRAGQNQRRQLAVLAARILSEEGVRDYHQAKLKAAQRLGLREEVALPANREIEEALKEHQRLFRGERQAAQLRRLRAAALEAMSFLSRYQPRLVGAVLEGTADADAVVSLHLFSDSAEEVMDFLTEHSIPFELDLRRVRLDRERERDLTLLRLRADEVPIELCLFPADGIRQPPVGPIDERPMRRASQAQVAALLSEPLPAPA